MTTELDEFVPVMRTDFVRRDIDGQSIVWSPIAAEPFVLDPVATIMLDVVDGEASIGQLAAEVGDEVGVPLDTARSQVQRVIQLFATAGLLTTSEPHTTADDAIARLEVFPSGSTPCSENEARLGTDMLHLRFGDQTIRIACDSRRATRTLREALAEHLVDGRDDDPLGFVYSAPQGLQRNHRLIDRSGFVLSSGRGRDPGLHALASHLTALLPPAAGTVRFRARAAVAGGQTILFLYPLLSFPEVDHRELRRAGVELIDRLAVDVEVATGRMMNPAIPWPALEAIGPGPGHLGPGGERRVTVVVDTAPPLELPPRERVNMVAALAASGTEGSPQDLVDAAVRLVEGAELRSVPPAPERVMELLASMGGGSDRPSCS